ncbi:hypothetical protein AMTR_s00162p00083730 [Amborella trichopoda]|uniref:Non-specific lipid-transfer protein n=2 Tax=Amborella trichopoda TaxID=13333 RepID=W1PNJ0_AMBTC|nr:hypothetical protein AMTR_s00162p00083730 [Amborella trichopoda]
MENIGPCVNYLVIKNGTGTPSTDCCTGVKNLKGMANTTENRRAICNCLENEAAKIPQIDPQAVKMLPEKCRVTLGFPISLNTTCSSIQ